MVGGRKQSGFAQVVVASGHMVDAPGRTAPRFPAEAEPDVTGRVRAALRGWKVGNDALVISGGARGADIIVAEQGRALGATVWLLLALPDEEFVERSVRLAGTDWEERFRRLRTECPTRIQADELGALPGTSDDPAEVFARNNRWCLDVAFREAAGPVRAVVVWDGAVGDGGGGTDDFVARAHDLGVEVCVISPDVPGGPTSGR
jgi:hypothetical protein